MTGKVPPEAGEVKTGVVTAVEASSLSDDVSQMATLRVRFGKAVRRLRKGAGFSQESFASECQIDRAYYGKIERGMVNVSLDNIEKIAKALGIGAGLLMNEADRER